MSNFLTNDINKVNTPVGCITPYAGIVDPSGWLICDGREILRTGIYFNLFTLISTNYGSGNGFTTFNIPDLRSKVIRGRDITNSISGTTTGSNSVTLDTSHMPSHTHSLSSHTHTYGHSHNVNHTHGVYHKHYYQDVAFLEWGGSNGNVFGSRQSDGDNSLLYRSTTQGQSFNSKVDLITGGKATSTDVVSGFNTGASGPFTSGTPSNNNSRSSGSGTAFSIIPINLTMNFIIKI